MNVDERDLPAEPNWRPLMTPVRTMGPSTGSKPARDL